MVAETDGREGVAEVPHERDPKVIAWFERALADARPTVRRRAIELLAFVGCPARRAWLEYAEKDDDPMVASAAVLVGAVLAVSHDEVDFELHESDFYAFATSRSSELHWEWEYSVKVCSGAYVPAAAVTVWTATEDDESARQMARLKASAGRRVDVESVGVIVGKRLVNEFTRAPRTRREAARWRVQGRPRYRDPPAEVGEDSGCGPARRYRRQRRGLTGRVTGVRTQQPHGRFHNVAARYERQGSSERYPGSSPG